MKKKLLYGIALNDSETPISKSKRIKGKSVILWTCPAYECWKGMLKRCYSDSYKSKHPTYEGCSVCDEWLYFSNFKEWYENNSISNYHLDKDLLLRGNKTYSPDSCVFIHGDINKFLISGNSNGMLSGAHLRPDNGRFSARCSNASSCKNEYLGQFDTEVEAHMAWAARKNEIAAMIASSDINMCERTRQALLNIDFRQVKTSEG